MFPFNITCMPCCLPSRTIEDMNTSTSRHSAIDAHLKAAVSSWISSTAISNSGGGDNSVVDVNASAGASKQQPGRQSSDQAREVSHRLDDRKESDESSSEDD